MATVPGVAQAGVAAYRPVVHVDGLSAKRESRPGWGAVDALVASTLE